MGHGQQSFSFEQKKSLKAEAMSVSDLNQAIKSNIEDEFHTIWVKGEISNFKFHSSGHFYFSLKDSKSQISIVMFRGLNVKLKFRPKDGMQVILRGKVTVYTPKGSYQILCETMSPTGQGDLQEAFEKLKIKLKNEGLFDSKKKKPLPFLPFNIVLVTSPTGAAVKDMIHVLKRRHPAAQITIVQTLTQGDHAARDLIRALKDAEKLADAEVIILSRGGGSLEDMWCFNDEGLARKIYSMKIPIISGVGHEIDFTISDFVADFRAPTPSVAAEIVCKNVDEIKEKISQSKGRLEHKIWNLIQNKKTVISHMSMRLVDPRNRFLDLRIKIDELIVRAQRSIESKIQIYRVNEKSYSLRLKGVLNIGNFLKQRLGFLSRDLINAQEIKLKNFKARLNQNIGVLKALNPFGVLDRGYAIVRNTRTGEIVKDFNSLRVKEKIKVQFFKGRVEAEITKKIKDGE